MRSPVEGQVGSSKHQDHDADPAIDGEKRQFNSAHIAWIYNQVLRNQQATHNRDPEIERHMKLAVIPTATSAARHNA